jgi:hypothetical protein
MPDSWKAKFASELSVEDAERILDDVYREKGNEDLFSFLNEKQQENKIDNDDDHINRNNMMMMGPQPVQQQQRAQKNVQQQQRALDWEIDQKIRTLVQASLLPYKEALEKNERVIEQQHQQIMQQNEVAWRLKNPHYCGEIHPLGTRCYAAERIAPPPPAVCPRCDRAECKPHNSCPQCHFCKQYGHMKSRCPAKDAYEREVHEEKQKLRRQREEEEEEKRKKEEERRKKAQQEELQKINLAQRFSNPISIPPPMKVESGQYVPRPAKFNPILRPPPFIRSFVLQNPQLQLRQEPQSQQPIIRTGIVATGHVSVNTHFAAGSNWIEQFNNTSAAGQR